MRIPKGFVPKEDSEAVKAVKSLYKKLYDDATESGFRIEQLHNYVKKAYKSEEDMT